MRSQYAPYTKLSLLQYERAQMSMFTSFDKNFEVFFVWSLLLLLLLSFVLYGVIDSVRVWVCVCADSNVTVLLAYRAIVSFFIFRIKRKICVHFQLESVFSVTNCVYDFGFIFLFVLPFN